MKKVIIIAFVSFICLVPCFARPKELSPEEQVIQKVIEVQKPKDELFLLSLDWISKTFRSAKAVVDFQDKEAGKIIGKASIPVTYNFGMVNDTFFNYTIEVKDNKARITIENAYFMVTVGSATARGDITNEFTMNECFRPEVDKLILSLTEFLQKTTEEW